jgi:hypothetical protein
VSTDELSQPASPASARAAGAVDVHAQEMVRKAADRGLISESQAKAILGANARALLDLPARAQSPGMPR